MKKLLSLSLFILVLLNACNTGDVIVWQLGQKDNSSNEFALSPDDYKLFLKNDFGWEDRFFLIGNSDPATDWPYVLPGPSDQWGGTWSTSGWRSHTLNILFGLKGPATGSSGKLTLGILDINSSDPPLLKVTLNGKSYKYRPPGGSGKKSPEGEVIPVPDITFEIAFEKGILMEEGNEINITSLEGSWLVFDYILLEASAPLKLTDSEDVFIRSVVSADYELESAAGRVQPLLVDVQHLSGDPELDVLVDNNIILSETIESGRYIFEAPMPVVKRKKRSTYSLRVNGREIQNGRITRYPEKLAGIADYIDTRTGTAHSRWMIAPGPWMPFSMVKLSPDNQNSGWQSGYDPIFESIAGFSHIHEWTLAGLLTMPVNGPLQTKTGDEKDPDSGYRSRIDKQTETAPPGYYSVRLSDYDIVAELTSTTRCGFQRYTYPRQSNGSRVLLDLIIPAEYTYMAEEVYIRKTGETTIEGFSRQLTPDTWSGGISQEYTVYFVAEFDRPIRNFGVWTENGVVDNTNFLSVMEPEDAGAYAEFDTGEDNIVQLRTGISYVSIKNARENLREEIKEPFGWDFDAVRDYHEKTWNDIFSRVKISTNDRREKGRFYNNMYRALCSRNIYSDVNGEWTDAAEKTRKMENPDMPALGCDAFWNTFWNLNQFWNLVTPEWSNRWVNSQLEMYRTNGWLAKGPAGMEYIPVMVAEHEIPLIVGAYQMGIRDYDAELAFEAARKMQTTPAGEVEGGFAGNRDLAAYLEHKYVPWDKGRFSNSLEYSFDDWTLGQFAKSLGKDEDYRKFNERGYYWKNVIDTETGFARMKDSEGKWLDDFDPFRSGANHHYVEGNAWQLTFFVPQDVTALAELIGKERFIERLDWGFKASEPWRYNGINDQYWDFPVMQGNQQSMHFAFLFNWLGRPWLTQKWSRSILERYYGYGVANAYLGDEDQGQMSAWFLMASLGLFQTDGGCSAEPHYEIGSPLFERVEIDLGERYGRGGIFIIEAKNASRKNKYVQSAILNGKELNSFIFPAAELLKGGRLELLMGPEPAKDWGLPE